MQIEKAGGRPQKPEAGGVLTGYKKVKTNIFIFTQISNILHVLHRFALFDIPKPYLTNTSLFRSG